MKLRGKSIKAGKEQLDFLRKRNAELLKNPQLDSLRTRLLKLGGMEIVFFFEIPHLSRLLADGVVWPSDGRSFVKGQRSDCHENSFKYATTHKNCIAVTGFALSDDGLWREHSWVWNKNKNRILETTVKREIYFGLALNTG